MSINIDLAIHPLMKRFVKIILVLVFLLAFAKVYEAQAQCAMCRAVLESEADNSTAKGINNGIVYLMAIPYILVGGVLYAVYVSRKKDKEKGIQ